MAKDDTKIEDEAPATGREPVNFRSRVAAEKRDRMRSRLLDATMRVCGGPGGPSAAVIDDVVGAAGVSRGAFYRYFQSLEEAVTTLVALLIADIVHNARDVFADVEDPVLGSAIGSQLLLYRAAMDRSWAGFVSGTSLILGDPALTEVLRETIGGGRASGAFRFNSLTAATDAFAGGLLAGVRRLGGFEGPPADYITEVSRLLLRGLGAPEDVAAAAVQQARARIEETAPRRLPWWRTA